MYFPKEMSSIKDTRLIGHWHNGAVPVFDVASIHGLNQIIGYVKHMNSGHGTVLYRGQAHLHPTLIPSILHGNPNQSQIEDRKRQLSSHIHNILCDDDLCGYLNFNDKGLKHRKNYKQHVTESMLQHYGVRTHFQDFVDNHWTALWFGLFEQKREPLAGYPFDSGLEQFFYQRRSAILSAKESAPECLALKEPDYIKIVPPRLDYILREDEYSETDLGRPLLGNLNKITDRGKREDTFRHLVKIDIANKERRNARLLAKWETDKAQVEKKNQELHAQYECDKASNKAYVYLLLYVADTQGENFKGVYAGTETITIDLRKALPSTLLRPCAQHGWTVRKIGEDADLSDGVVCVLRLTVDIVDKMLGTGLLVSQENFFPPAERDYGYGVLLGREDGVSSASTGKKDSSTHPKLFPFATLQHFVNK